VTFYAHITGWGKYVPERVVTNDDIAQFMDTSDEWIKTRTGISERRFAGDEESLAMKSLGLGDGARDEMSMEVDWASCGRFFPGDFRAESGKECYVVVGNQR